MNLTDLWTGVKDWFPTVGIVNTDWPAANVVDRRAIVVFLFINMIWLLCEF